MNERGDRSPKANIIGVPYKAAELAARGLAELAGESEEDALKAELARHIAVIIRARKLTQVKAAELLSLRQPDVSEIARGNTQKFSIGRLLRCLDRLDYRVHMSVRPKPTQERRLPFLPPE